MTIPDPDVISGQNPAGVANATPPVRAPIRFTRLAAVGVAVLFMLATWAVWKFGGFDLTATIDGNGGRQTVANTFATVDHPFHATRADSLLNSLQDGQLLRWLGHHQGGYPVEFYPLGIPWLDVGLWALLLGTVPVVAVHKLAVLVVFVLPAVGFWLLARGDRLNPLVPVLALAIHVSTPGLWHTGGMIELIEWGLIANVGGATLAFIALAALARHVLEGGGGFAALAIVSSSAALYTNTRSGVAVGVAALSILVAITLGIGGRPEVSMRIATLRVALVGGASMLLSAPLLLSLVQYVDLYFFVHYMEYATLGEFWRDTLASVSRVLVVVAIAGAILPFFIREAAVWRIVAVTAIAYVALTVVLSLGGLNQGLIEQLEAPRLMPFQRLLLVYLAAATIGWGLDFLANKAMPRWREPVSAAVLVVCAVIAISQYDGAFGRVPDTHATSIEPTTGIVETAHFSGIVAEANEIRAEGTAIYVVGDHQSWWHQQLWGPSHSNAPFFYDDWMWYWHRDFDAPYDFNVGHFIPEPAATFTSEWLAANGIGVVVVTNMPVPLGAQDPRLNAETNPALEYRLSIGEWDLYSVVDARPLVTNGDTNPSSLTVENETIVATFDSASGQVEVRRNWFPRWEASADGANIEIERTSNGYMQLNVPDGSQTIELRYSVTPVDWLGRALALAGVMLTIAIGLGLSRTFRTQTEHQ